MTQRQRCLPVRPTVQIMQVVVVDYYTGKGDEAEPAHLHRAIYTMDGDLITNECTYWPKQESE